MPTSDWSKAGALLVEQPELGTLAVRGRDRKSWLNGLLTCDVGPLSSDRGVWGLLLNKQGKITSDVNLVESNEIAYMSTAPGQAPSLLELLDRHLIMEDAELTDRSAELGWLMLHGRDAWRIARQAGGRALASGAIDWTGLGGAALVVERARVHDVAAELAAAGATRSTPDAWLELRISSGLPAFGLDFDERDNPHEASLDRRAVSWTKGCYLGQEVVCMQDMRGKVKRRIVPLWIEGGTPAQGAAVYPPGGGESVGEVTSVASRGEGALALARVKAGHANPDARLEIEGRPATVVAPVEQR